MQAGGGAALAGRCTPEGHIPYAPFAEALGGLAAAVGPAALADAVGVQAGELARSSRRCPTRRAGGPDGARHRLLAAVDAALVAVARTDGLVLVLDDLHWADEPTLGMLAHLAGSPERARLLIVATLRTTETRAAPALAALLASVRRDPAVLDLRLDGLTPEAAALLADAAGAAGTARRSPPAPAATRCSSRSSPVRGSSPMASRPGCASSSPSASAGSAIPPPPCSPPRPSQGPSSSS